MNISEIIKLESERKSADTYGRIHFIKEGNFYRAHDWSAWLATRFPLTDAWNGITIIAKKTQRGVHRRMGRISCKVSRKICA